VEVTAMKKKPKTKVHGNLEWLEDAERLVEIRRDAVDADRRARGLSYQELVAERGPLLQAYRQAVRTLMDRQRQLEPVGESSGN
jgi:hypothetical protein